MNWFRFDLFASFIDWRIIAGVLAFVAISFAIWWYNNRRIPKKTVAPGAEDVIPGTITQVEVLEIDGKPIKKEVKEEGKYPAFIMSEDRPWHFGKIPEPVGHTFIFNTTMPHPGDHYIVKPIVSKEGIISYEAYDPRTASIVADETPEDAWEKTQDWEEDIPYIDELGIWEQLPKVLGYLVIIAAILLAFVYVGQTRT